MNTKDKDSILYTEDKKHGVKRKKKKKLRLFNVLMLFMAAYFVFTIARQELKLRDINAEIQAVNSQYEDLKQQESVINKKIEEASSTHMIENKAKSILGWVSEDEYKVIEKKQ